MPVVKRAAKGSKVSQAGPLPSGEDPGYEYEEGGPEGDGDVNLPAYTEEEAFAPTVAERATETVGLAVGVAAEVATSKTLLLPVELRTKQTEDPYWKTPEGETALQGLSDPGIFLGDLTDTMRTVLGAEAVDCIKAETTTVRDFFERSTPSTQCGNVIGDSKGAVCWICGTRIIPKETSFKPECEHVFPILQALVFTGLYETQLFESLVDTGQQDAYRAGLRLEYRWAHRICNQVKNDAHFVVLTRDSTEMAVFGIEDAKITEFLTALETTTKWGGGKKLLAHLKKETGGDPVAYLRGRVSAIREICTPILETIAKMKLTPAQHARATAMHIKEFVAADGRCIQDVPPPRIKPIAQGRLDLGTFGNTTPADAKAVVDYGIPAYGRPFLNVLLGSIQVPLRDILRKAGKSAAERTKILSDLALVEQGYLAILPTHIMAEMNTFRQRLYGAVAALPVDAGTKWSRFQVLLNQFTFLFIAFQVYTNGNLLATQFPDEAIRPFILEAIKTPEVQTKVSAAFNVLYQKTVQGSPDIAFNTVMATPPKEFPSDAATPVFGGGHLGGRPALYRNVRRSA